VSELRVRLATLVGFLPVGIERLWRAAVGPPESWAWLAAAFPWVLAAVVTVGVGGLSLLTLRVAIESPPFTSVWGAALGAFLAAIGQPLLERVFASVLVRAVILILAGIIGGALGAFLSAELVSVPVPAAIAAGLVAGAIILASRRLMARRVREPGEGLRLVPLLVSMLFVLSVLPLIQAGAELIVTRSNVADFVDRRVGFSSTLVEISGYTLALPFEAEPPTSQTGARNDYAWFALRDDPKTRKVALVRTAMSVAAAADRDVLARVVTDPAAVEAATAGARMRGWEPPVPATGIVLQELSLEAAQGVFDARSVPSVRSLKDVADGTVVRMGVQFSGLGVAACVADASCDARRLAGGVGPWEQFATDRDDAWIVVQTPYPPSLAPVHLWGRQTAAAPTVGRFMSLPWISPLLGWAQVLHAAIIDQDPSLPVDHLWLGPILFAALAVLLLVSERIGYPIFRAIPIDAAAAPPERLGTVAGVATGRISPPGRRPIELEATRIDIRLEDDQPVLTLPGPVGTPMTIRLPRGFGALSGVEVGELRLVSARRPAIRASWYGSQVLLEFASNADRASATEILRRFRDAAEA